VSCPNIFRQRPWTYNPEDASEIQLSNPLPLLPDPVIVAYFEYVGELEPMPVDEEPLCD
jgi:hypothetical protein